MLMMPGTEVANRGWHKGDWHTVDASTSPGLGTNLLHSRRLMHDYEHQYSTSERFPVGKLTMEGP